MEYRTGCVDNINLVPGTTDEDLINRCRCGDEDAFNILHSRYELKLYRHAFLMSGSREDACDIVQDTFIKAYRALSGFRGDCTVYTWLMRICTNLCRTHARNKTLKVLKLSEIAVMADFLRAQDKLDPRHDVMQRSEAETIRQLLLKLPINQRELLVMHEYQELSTEEIARIQKSTTVSVRVRLFRARKKLKEIAQATLGEGIKDEL